MHVSVLLLNADAQPLSLLPLSTISWQNAIKAMFSDKVHVVKDYDNLFINSSSISLPVPSIVMLNTYHRPPTKAKYTRKNLYIRDSYCCQYCGENFIHSELTIDHVVPKSKGGKLTWENSVSACAPCNFKKNDRMIKPIKEPQRPTWFQLNTASKNYNRIIPDIAWQDYIQWPDDKIQVADSIILA